MSTSTALLLADLVGVAVFAASGASAAVAKRLDLFGVIFVGFVAALGGGILRDLVIDEVPPLAFADRRYPMVAAVAATIVFYLHPQLARLRRTVLVLDAAGPMAAAAILVFGVRLLALRQKWSAPVARTARLAGSRGPAERDVTASRGTAGTAPVC